MGYGGYESFVDKLVSYQQNPNIQYWIACLPEAKYEQKRYKRAFCVPIHTPSAGPATMPLMDILALRRFLKMIRAGGAQETSIVYILACRIGPFLHHYAKKLHKLGVKVLLNPDGHEWKRGKWSPMIRKYWKLSERLMVKNADSKRVRRVFAAHDIHRLWRQSLCVKLRTGAVRRMVPVARRATGFILPRHRPLRSRKQLRNDHS